MSLTLLELVQQVHGELGLDQPISVIGNANKQVTQFYALTKRLGKDLIREYEWQRLIKQYISQTTAAVNMTGDMTDGSPVITTLSSTAALAVGDVVVGTTFGGIPPGAEILLINSSTQVTLTLPATETGSSGFLFKRQDYALPLDFDRMIADTHWDRTENWQNSGPKTSQEWQTLQSGVVQIAPPFRFRIYRNKLRLFPAPTAVSVVAYEYVSNYWTWVPTFGDEPSWSEFITDGDVCVFPDDLMQAGLKYYFLKAKKLDYAMEMAEYSEILSIRKSQDVPSGVRSLTPSYPGILGPSVPEGNWDL